MLQTKIMVELKLLNPTYSINYKMKYCSKCIIPETRPDQFFDKNGTSLYVWVWLRRPPGPPRIRRPYIPIQRKQTKANRGPKWAKSI